MSFVSLFSDFVLWISVWQTQGSLHHYSSCFVWYSCFGMRMLDLFSKYVNLTVSSLELTVVLFFQVEIDFEIDVQQVWQVFRNWENRSQYGRLMIFPYLTKQKNQPAKLTFILSNSRRRQVKLTKTFILKSILTSERISINRERL